MSIADPPRTTRNGPRMSCCCLHAHGRRTRATAAPAIVSSHPEPHLTATPPKHTHSREVVVVVTMRHRKDHAHRSRTHRATAHKAHTHEETHRPRGLDTHTHHARTHERVVGGGCESSTHTHRRRCSTKAISSLLPPAYHITIIIISPHTRRNRRTIYRLCCFLSFLVSSSLTMSKHTVYSYSYYLPLMSRSGFR